MKKICILGSTGSIGTQTLDVVRNLEDVCVVALSGYKNILLLEEQIREFKPMIACTADEEHACGLKKRLYDIDIKIVSGMEGMLEIVSMPEIDTVVNAVVGCVGLEPTLSAIKNKKDIAVANKETLVVAGQLVMSAAKENGVNILPIDSEHSAILQCLRGNLLKDVSRLHLTASGGPFRTRGDLRTVTIEEALAHPNWKMGKKITVDSASMMNKGLEVIEARWLFDIQPDNINVLVHPQSIIHSMVEFIDGSVMAQLGQPDMRIPIQYSLIYPERVKNDFRKLDFFEKNILSFEKPDYEKFPCLRLAYEALKASGTMPAVMNGANEAAVEKFLNGEIKFIDIPVLIEKAMEAYTIKQDYELADVLEADRFARKIVKGW